MTVKVKPTLIRVGEVFSYGAGLLLTGFFVVSLAQGEVERQGAITSFEQQREQYDAATSPQLAMISSGDDSVPADLSVNAVLENTAETLFSSQSTEPDTTLWAPGRVADYEASLKAELPPVIGVLDIPSVKLNVPVYQSNSDMVMDRASGIIDGMAYPHEEGNIGISGHRDGYFRALKDVAVGDTIVLQTLEGEKRFRIDSTQIVEISDTHLLQDTRDQTVTLVTCYPFYFVGHAPQRFIVTASLDTTYVNQN